MFKIESIDIMAKVKIEPGEVGTPREGTTYWVIKCPGCRSFFGGSYPKKHIWSEKHTFNGDLDSPTFSPSLLTETGDGEYRCHSFVRDGKIEFLSDCTHSLRGKTVDLPDWRD